MCHHWHGCMPPATTDKVLPLAKLHLLLGERQIINVINMISNLTMHVYSYFVHGCGFKETNTIYSNSTAHEIKHRIL